MPRHLRNFFFFIIFSTAFGMPANAAVDNVVLTARKMYVASAESQEFAATADVIYRDFTQHLKNKPRFTYVSIDSIQAYLGQVFLADFVTKADPLRLLTFRRQTGMEIALFFYLEQKRGEHSLRVRAVEFPSDVFISDIEIRLTTNPEDIPAAIRKLDIFVDMIRLNQHDMGYSFHKTEKGVLLLTDSLSAPQFIDIMNGLNNALVLLPLYENTALRVKVLVYNAGQLATFARQADTILAKNAAQALFIVTSDSQRQSLYFPTQLGKPSVLANTLPMWPPFPAFRNFTFATDSAFCYTLANSLFLQPYGFAHDLIFKWGKRGEMARALLLKNIQAQQGTQSLDKDVDKTVAELYEAFAACFQKNDREFGWIKLNQADLRRKMGKWEYSQEAAEAALDNFQHVGNSFGQLFALVRIGEAQEKLNQTERALVTYHNSLTVAKSIKDELTTAFVYFRLGTIYFNTNRPIEAWDYFGNSADSYLRVGDTLQVVQLNTRLGILMRGSNFTKKSREYFEKAKTFARIIDNDRELAGACYHLAVTLKDLDDPARALENFQAAGDLYEILADTVGLANTEEHIGDILFAQEKWKAAQQSFEYAARFYKYIPEVEGIIRSLTKSADTAAARTRWLRAQNDYDEALQYANLYEKPDWVSIVIYKKGLAHVREGQYAVGQEELQLAGRSNLSQEAINAYMTSFIRELEEELESRGTGTKP